MEIVEDYSTAIFKGVRKIFNQDRVQYQKNWAKMSDETIHAAAHTLGIVDCPDTALAQFIDILDIQTCLPVVKSLNMRIEPGFLYNAVGPIERILSLCSHQAEKGASYCISTLNYSENHFCSGDNGFELKASSSKGRSIQIDRVGRFVATLVSEGKNSIISLYDISRYGLIHSELDECGIADIKIPQESSAIDYCFFAERNVMLRVKQKLYKLFISESPHRKSKKLVECFEFPWKQPSVFDDSSSLLLSLTTTKILAATAQGNDESILVMHVLKEKGTLGWHDVAILPSEKRIGVLRKAHPRGIYINVQRQLDESNNNAVPQDTKAMVYDIRKDEPTFCTLDLGLVTAVEFSPSGNQVVFAIMPTEWNGDGQIVVYSIESPAVPEFCYALTAKTCGIIQRLAWPQWGAGIIAIVRQGDAVVLEEGDGLRALISAWRALKSRDSFLKTPC